MPHYIRRKLGEDKVDYYDDSLTDVLKETFGIIIYQEQVLQIAQILAGYTLSEADILRKAMGKKIQSEMDAQRIIFTEKAKQKEIITEEKARLMFDIIAKFAGYGFNRAHAFSYSYIAYQTAYLKAHYPVEFLTANLNLEIDDTDKINSFILDAKCFNIEIVPPSVNTSQVYFSFEGRKIFYGLAGLKGMGSKSGEEIVNVRNALLPSKKFESLEQFCDLAGVFLNKKSLENLILSGSLDEFKINRRTLIENLEKLLNFHKEETTGASLFETKKELILKQFEEYPDAKLLQLEFDAFGFYLMKHPLFHL
jgi:DNA polymerase-3 subunit alpha